jgi:hypothetical protein
MKKIELTPISETKEYLLQSNYITYAHFKMQIITTHLNIADYSYQDNDTTRTAPFQDF